MKFINREEFVNGNWRLPYAYGLRRSGGRLGDWWRHVSARQPVTPVQRRVLCTVIALIKSLRPADKSSKWFRAGALALLSGLPRPWTRDRDRRPVTHTRLPTDIDGTRSHTLPSVGTPLYLPLSLPSFYHQRKRRFFPTLSYVCLV